MDTGLHALTPLCPAHTHTQIAQLGAMVGQGGGGGIPPGATVVRLTADENAAVERLSSMGFDRNRVLEAFLACDKNEEMAANYLVRGGVCVLARGSARGACAGVQCSTATYLRSPSSSTFIFPPAA